MDRVFIYLDNSNIYIPAKRLAKMREGTPGADVRVRLDFEALMQLARAGRPAEKAFAAGSKPPYSDPLWERLKASGVELELYNRGNYSSSEMEVPDNYIQTRMLEDSITYQSDPGIIVLLTGDGKGYTKGTGFHAALERLHQRGWRIELLSWAVSCSRSMRRWVEENGVFVPLDDFYESITFLEPSRPGYEPAPRRRSAPLDLSRRPRV